MATLKRQNADGSWELVQTVGQDLASQINELEIGKLDKSEFESRVKTNVPARARFTDTIYEHPSTHPADMITENPSKRFVSDAERYEIEKVKHKADREYVDDLVRTPVPRGAKFTDTIVDVSNKVDKIPGKGLSTNDYTNEDRRDIQDTVYRLVMHEGGDASKENVHGLRADGISLGAGSDVAGSGVAIGKNSVSSGSTSTSVSVGSRSMSGDSAISIGFGTMSRSSGIAIGSGTNADSGGVAIGRSSHATGYGTVAIGTSVRSTNNYNGILGGRAGGSTAHIWTVPGNFTVNGTKNFEMPHPKPEKKNTHRIRHSAVETNTCGDNLYRYEITSMKNSDKKTISLPDYFVHLNRDVQIFVTPQGHFGSGYGKLNRTNEQLEIFCELEGKYNVLVIGTRNDDHQSIRDWDIRGVEREIGESWTGETYAYEVDEIIEVTEIKEEIQ